MSELTIVLQKLQTAKCPEDVFGMDIKQAYRALLRVVHPDRNDADPLAVQATELLNELKMIADGRMATGTYGRKLPLPARLILA